MAEFVEAYLNSPNGFDKLSHLNVLNDFIANPL